MEINHPRFGQCSCSYLVGLQLTSWQFIGQYVNSVTKGRWLPYPEQKDGYVLPERYTRLPRTGTKCSEGGMTVSPTDTIDPSCTNGPTETEVEVELDLSGRPREEEVEVPKEVILVTWEGEDDPENPLNWYVIFVSIGLYRSMLIICRAFKKKVWTLFCIMIMTFTVYMASAIWSPAGGPISISRLIIQH